MKIEEIKSHDELLSKIKDRPKAYLLLFKPGSEPNECALRNIREVSGDLDDVLVMFADVSMVRDIHPNYGVTSVPSLLVFEESRFVNAIKGCNENNYYRTLFEDAQFAAIRKESGTPQKSVTVYSTPTCTWCNTLKTYLKKNRILFTDIDVSRDPQAAQDLVRRTGQQGVPQTEIEGEIVVGFDKNRINQLLGING